MFLIVYFDQKVYFKMPLSNICEKYRKLVILLVAIKLEWYIILRNFFISEHIFISTLIYLKENSRHQLS